jgi:lysophospholipid acyltransferase (LPLAT)-like uncharacterized protein
VPQTFKKKIKYAAASPVLAAYLRGLAWTSRRRVRGMDKIRPFLDAGQPIIPVFWHRQNIPAAIFLLDWRAEGLKTGFLASPSRDGEIAARVFGRRGVRVIRGSSSRTGAQAIRDLYHCVARDGISPASTPDGPRGPIYEFKVGPLMLSQMTGAPVVPMAAVASRYRELKSWDRCMVPKWFGTLSLTVGEPVHVEKGLSMAGMQAMAAELGEELKALENAAAV